VSCSRIHFRNMADVVRDGLFPISPWSCDAHGPRRVASASFALSGAFDHNADLPKNTRFEVLPHPGLGRPKPSTNTIQSPHTPHHFAINLSSAVSPGFAVSKHLGTILGNCGGIFYRWRCQTPHTHDRYTHQNCARYNCCISRR